MSATIRGGFSRTARASARPPGRAETRSDMMPVSMLPRGLFIFWLALSAWSAPPPEGRQIWSFRPLREAAPGKTIDSLLLPSNGSAPPAAGKLTLMRRAYFDLTGLPPTESEARAFLADRAPDAYARMIERLLASPRYGEHWGRHWLDVARYADSTGADEDHRYPHAWRYRDYVIDAFNRDLPYDQFIREQIAGDLLPAEDGGGGVNTRGIVATGFLALGPKLIAEQDKVKMFYDIVDEQIDVTGKAFLGLTIACARCHDHKFDPILTTDYYALASIFASTKQLATLEGTVSELYVAPLVDKPAAEAWLDYKKKVADKQKDLDAVVARESAAYRQTLAPRLADYMLAAWEKRSGAAAGDLDPAVLEKWVKYLEPGQDRRPQLEAFQNATGKAAAARQYQAQFLAAMEARKDKTRKFQAGDDRFYSDVAGGPFGLPKEKRGPEAAALEGELKKLKDAQPADPPLACGVAEGDSVEQRVFVRGNPESKGEAVSKRFPMVLAGRDQAPITKGSGRRELADWLASPRNPLTARVMVNRIWQWHFDEGIVKTPSNFGVLGARPTHPELLDFLAAKFIESGWSVKAMHRLIMSSAAYRQARGNGRRLQVEELRDALLAIDGSLDPAMGGTTQSGVGTDKEFSDDRKTQDPDRSTRRLVYLPLRRSNLPSLLNLFDFGDATTSCEGRTASNVAPQALFMMNGPFVEARARGLAARLSGSDAERVEQAHWRVLGRPASAPELRGGIDYVAHFPGARDLAWMSYTRSLLASNEFLYVH